MEKDVVKKFIDSPLHISDDIVAGYGDGAKHYRDLVCLLHLLLVKHEEKKGFVFVGDDVDNFFDLSSSSCLFCLRRISFCKYRKNLQLKTNN